MGINSVNSKTTLNCPQPGRCRRCNKVNRTRTDARRASADYNNRVPVTFQFGEMNFYYCNYSRHWHIGHQGKSQAIVTAANRMWGDLDPMKFKGMFK